MATLFLLSVTLGVAGACSTLAPLPAPRSLVVRSGARLHVDMGRLQPIHTWVMEQQESIVQDPSFWVIQNSVDIESYPWDGLAIHGDTAEVLVPRFAPDTGSFMSLYGHFHLMKLLGRLSEFLPEAVDGKGVELDGYELEKAILTRLSDAWLYGRASFDMTPYGPLDELMYARESGFLDAFILTARGNEFVDEREAWLAANPVCETEFHAWFLETFEQEPLGMRTADAP